MLLLLRLLSVTVCRAVLISWVAQIPDNVQFDFVIVGGGACGSVVANRLTEDPHVKVIVLEAGPSHEGVLETQVPFLAPDLSWPSPYEWNYTTSPQPGLGGRSIGYPRGHILGGSTTTNWLIYTRGSSEDFDRYAQETGDSGWSWEQILPYFKKSERWTTPADNHDTDGQFDPAVHEYHGKVAVSLPGFQTPIVGKVIEAVHQLGGDFKFNLDHNSGSPLGVGRVQVTVDGHIRSSASTAYLSPKYMKRKNLWVVVNAQVSRVVKNDILDSAAFRTVEFRQRYGGPLKTLTATKEVILSAGSIGTPHILLNSGIGDAKSLETIGVKSLVDLHDVGKNLSDHTVVGNAWLMNRIDTFANITEDAQVSMDGLTQWQELKTGPYVNALVDFIGFVRLQESLVPKPDPAAGPHSPHYEFAVSNRIPRAPGFVVPPGNLNFLVLPTVLVSPTSRGSVKLRSNNSFDTPSIDPALLKTDFDKHAMREAVKGALRFVAAPAWSQHIIGPVGGLEAATNDDGLDAYITATANTLFHPVGTASMSPRGAKYGVTDPDLRVKNVDGLRIVDISVLPYVPSAHTQAAAYAIAERASDLIKDFYRPKNHILGYFWRIIEALISD